jgi:hypothetical protein
MQSCRYHAPGSWFAGGTGHGKGAWARTILAKTGACGPTQSHEHNESHEYIRLEGQLVGMPEENSRGKVNL